MEEKKELFPREFWCSCGRVHRMGIQDIFLEKGAIQKLPGLLDCYQVKKVFLLADHNTWTEGRKVQQLLEERGFPCESFVYEAPPKPDEAATGACAMRLAPDCDVLIAVGSGVLNDICKIMSHISGKPYIIVATAPSMDGYASSTSSMVMDGLKVSLPAACAKAIIGDTDILCAAPGHMLLAGLGDMLAKYVSICEWRLSHIITGEYYCETIAVMVREAVKKCVYHAQGLLDRSAEAVQAVMEGLVAGGIAMSYAGISRPASGVEHYLSHIWDMRGLTAGTPVELHGIQCAVGTLTAVRLYEQLAAIVPNRQKACAYAETFDYNAWSRRLEAFLGKGARAMIAGERREQKYSPARHRERLTVILKHWDRILAVIREELPASAALEDLYRTLGLPLTVADMGMDPETLPMTFQATKDIRDKYVLSRLAWDLGVIDDLSLTLLPPGQIHGKEKTYPCPVHADDGAGRCESKKGENKMKNEKNEKLPIIVEGHRGYCAAYPENTMVSYDAALELGVDAIEFDVWLTRDKVPVLMHDGNCLRTCGLNRFLRDMTLEEVKQLEPAYRSKFGDRFIGQGLTVPTLEELLIHCSEKRPDLILGVEIKEYTEETVDLTVALLKRYGFFDRCYFYAFNGRVIKYLKTRHQGRTMGYPDFEMGEFQPDTYDYYDEIGLGMNLVKSELFPFYQEKGFPMHLFCADTKEDVELCIQRGASLITANDPLPLMRRLGRLE